MLLNIYKNKFIFMYIIRYMWNYQQSFAILFVIQCSYSTNYKILVRIIAIWLRTSVKHSVKIFFFFLSLSFFRSCSVNQWIRRKRNLWQGRIYYKRIRWFSAKGVHAFYGRQFIPQEREKTSLYRHTRGMIHVVIHAIFIVHLFYCPSSSLHDLRRPRFTKHPFINC